MNRVGKSYRSERPEGVSKFVGSGKTNGSVIVLQYDDGHSEDVEVFRVIEVPDSLSWGEVY